MNLKKLSVIAPSFKSKELSLLFVKSFEKFKPKNLFIHYIIVENSSDVSYKAEILKLPNVTWIQNPNAGLGSEANASGVEVGLSKTQTEFVFIAHNDTAVVDSRFFSSFDKKISEGYELVGTLQSVSRTRAYHISGLMIKTSIARKVDLRPIYSNGFMIEDVGDPLTTYCREKGILTYCFKNTSYNEELHENLSPPFGFFKTATCIDDEGFPIFLHLSRGTPKSQNTFSKPDRINLKDWIYFLENNVGIV